jgi:transcriptional regulator with XRE-family HTH domain
MDGFSLATPEQISKTLAVRVKALRLAKGWKQVTLAERSGVSLASLRRFEATGQASLQHLLQLVFALNRLDDFDALLQAPRLSTLSELEAAEKQPTRRRGRL